MKLNEVVSALEHFAPLPLQESYDNAGLQIGLTEGDDVSGALLCLDVTEAVVDEAVSRGCNVIVSHHPLIFRPLKRLTGSDYVQRTVVKAIKSGVAIVAMHTNMDAARGGVNDKMAQKMGLQAISPIGRARQAAAGETVVEGSDGIIGQLEAPMAARDFLLMLKQAFGVESLQANELLHRPIQKVALCGGAGSFLLDEAIACGADAFVTGEMSYHMFFGQEQRIQIAVMGHYQSEQFTYEIFQQIIREQCPGLRVCVTELNTNPINYI